MTFLETEYPPAGGFLRAHLFTGSAMFQKNHNSTRFVSNFR